MDADAVALACAAQACRDGRRGAEQRKGNPIVAWSREKRPSMDWFSRENLQGGAPPSYKWIIIAVTIDISPINHSYWKPSIFP